MTERDEAGGRACGRQTAGRIVAPALSLSYRPLSTRRKRRRCSISLRRKELLVKTDGETGRKEGRKEQGREGRTERLLRHHSPVRQA